LQSSKTGPSEATISAGGGADLFRPVIRLQKQLLDELQQPAAKLALIRLNETSRMKDIGVSSVHYEDRFGERRIEVPMNHALGTCVVKQSFSQKKRLTGISREPKKSKPNLRLLSPQPDQPAFLDGRREAVLIWPFR
jgi:hypothetical protein